MMMKHSADSHREGHELNELHWVKQNAREQRRMTAIEFMNPLRSTNDFGTQGELASKPFFTKIGLDDVSCLPLQMTVGRLTGSQATLNPK